jgi:hypothetical protein
LRLQQNKLAHIHCTDRSIGGGGYERAYCNKTIAAQSELFARGYFYVSQSEIVDESDRFYFIIFRAGNSDRSIEYSFLVEGLTGIDVSLGNIGALARVI